MQVLKNEPVKAYNISVLDDDTAEINMYGEVVSQYPVDWWTGEKILGNFIALDEFLDDLKEIENKANINVHINSVGGDFYAGLSIYNRLKALPGNITTINDGLAASAASIIFQAGNTRKMNAGSNLMIHGVSALLFDYYNTEQLKAIIKQFTAHNNAAIGVYAERSGKTKEECKNLMSGETWLTGQEAVDAGLADEVIDSIPVTMRLSHDRNYLISNGVRFSTAGMNCIPQSIPVSKSALPVEHNQRDNANKNLTGGKESMEIKTVEELKAAFPELTTQIESAAKESGRAEGVSSERNRLQGIEAIENAIADKEIVKNAKYGEKPMNAADLALVAMQKEAEIRNSVLNKIDNDSKATEGVVSVPNKGNEGVESDESKVTDTVNVAVEALKMIGGKK
ncbi:MAG: head maturation protease, ClpP-related [Anaerotignum sp.]